MRIFNVPVLMRLACCTLANIAEVVYHVTGGSRIRRWLHHETCASSPDMRPIHALRFLMAWNG